MDTIDLDIRNYKAIDILNLFNLEPNFSEKELKQAYKVTLMTHPDKSKLDKKYFLFFSKAFKRVKHMYDYIHREINTENPDLDIDNIKKNRTESLDEYKERIKYINSGSKEFIKEFNDAFDKIQDKEFLNDGYGEWMKENTGINVDSSGKMETIINDVKKRTREMVEYNGFKELHSNGGNSTELKGEIPKQFTQELFGKLPYTDYKQAQEECVIPVDDRDLESRKTFTNVQNMKIYRKNNERIISEQESEEIISQRRKAEDIEAIEISYKLEQDKSKYREKKKLFESHFKLLRSE